MIQFGRGTCRFLGTSIVFRGLAHNYSINPKLTLRYLFGNITLHTLAGSGGVLTTCDEFVMAAFRFRT